MSGIPLLLPRGKWLNIVGQSYCQAELEAIVENPAHSGVEHRCIALLVPEPGNRYDANAVSVQIDGVHVGYLPREIAPYWSAELSDLIGKGFQPMATALIVGGRQSAGHREPLAVRLAATVSSIQ